MKTQNFIKLIITMMVVLVFGGLSSGVMAAGTSSGLTISNQASVDYKVATVSQPTANSNNYQFTVDTKIDLLVEYVSGGNVLVTPGTNDNVLKFKVTNQGNEIQDFRLEAIAVVGDDDDADAVSVVVEADAFNTPGSSYDAGNTGTYIDEMDEDDYTFVYILGDFNTTGKTDGHIASYDLKVVAAVGGGAAALGADETHDNGSADGEGTVEVVFGDGAGSADPDVVEDGFHSAQGDYEIATANLSVVKSSTVISDPFNDTTNPKRIPGAVVQYQIVITNAAGAATATDIAITDSLVNEIVTQSRLAFKMDVWVGTDEIWIDHPADGDDEVNDGGTVGDTFLSTGETKNGVTADFGNTVANVLTVTGVTLAAGESATIRFQVTIQ